MAKSWPAFRAAASMVAKFGTMRTDTNFRVSPTTIAFVMYGEVFNVILDRSGCHEFSCGCLQQLFLAVGDREVTIVVESADVAGAEPAVRVKGLARRFRLVDSSPASRRAFDKNLAVVRDLYLHMRESGGRLFRF